MARPIVLSNGELHVGLNKWGLVHDFYYPYVGLENHASGDLLRHHIGVWVDGAITWLDGPGWTITQRYPHNSLIGHTIAKNESIGIVLEFDDFVDSAMSAFLRNIHIINLRDSERTVRLFMNQAFVIGDSRSNTDTAQYLPSSNAILHYRGRRAFVIAGIHEADATPFDQYTVGLFGIEGKEGTWRDADDGELSFGTVEHGRVDSTLRFSFTIPAHSSTRAHYWIAAGKSTREALYIHKEILEQGLLARLNDTAHYWHHWLEPAHKVVDRLPKDHRESFIHSLLIIKSQIDKRGAVIASTDSSLLRYWRDAYAYCWPRDGALVLWPLIRLGYTDEARRFFEFCKRGLSTDGYLMHKYRADGALGSSWHPYVHGDTLGPPIQEDETALVLFMFAQFYQKNPNDGLLREFYTSFVQPMANFLTDYTDASTGLPRASYDLWEESYLTTTFSTAATYGALVAASELAAVYGRQDDAVKWRTAAEDMQRAAMKHLYNEDRSSFLKGVRIKEGAVVERNDTIDMSSIFGVFMFGLFPPDDDRLARALDTAKTVFGFSYERPGLPRYENDSYLRSTDDSTGNWWFITGLWVAQYEIEHGNTEIAERILTWTKDHMLPSGVLSEQVNPLNGSQVSVAPLTWSHAEYVATLLDLITETPEDL